MDYSGFTTRVLHTRYLKNDPYGSLHMPVYDTVAFEFDLAEDMELTFQGKKPDHVYSRISNPTVENFENIIRVVTDALTVTALSSGMAAISTLFLTLLEAGDNIITSKHLFGNTYSLFETTLKPFGLQTRYTDLTDPGMVAKQIDDKTRAIFLETITNPQLEVADIKALADIAKNKGIPLIVDTTITPPYLFNSKKHGVNIEVISSTKYISGGATTIGGLIIDNGTFDWSRSGKFVSEATKYGPFALSVKLKREVSRNLGACLSPHNAYLQTLGLETLPLRVDKSCRNAFAIAGHLEEMSQVKSVNYPGLKSSKFHDVARKQFGDKPGAILTFDLDSKERCFSFMNNLNIIRRATNLNDNKTLILHPASTIFCEYDADTKKQMGVRETMIRLAVGIEDVKDLITDINEAMKKTYN
ncbi:MAG: O-acetylhomoserine aminocarboxypropyltransferase/cysteine synthase [Chlorobi bacterium]|nr:O-acetylhomoserine aminocarboxypropyltransferase/cysteine synthase [Chlorobiota bacterium]